MKAITVFNDLLSFLMSQRRSGTTTLIKKIASENDVWILVPNEECKKHFGDNAISFDDIRRGDGISGRGFKPILVDNYTLMLLSEIGINDISNLWSQINHRNDLLKDIKTSISRFERINGSLL